MPTYLTRHMVATRDMHYGDKPVRKGERFQATEVDADYLLERGSAEEAALEAKPAVAKPAAKPTPQPDPEAPQINRGRRTRSFTQEATPSPADSLVMTSRDVPGPAQDASAVDISAKPDADS